MNRLRKLRLRTLFTLGVFTLPLLSACDSDTGGGSAGDLDESQGGQQDGHDSGGGFGNGPQDMGSGATGSGATGTGAMTNEPDPEPTEPQPFDPDDFDPIDPNEAVICSTDVDCSALPTGGDDCWKCIPEPKAFLNFCRSSQTLTNCEGLCANTASDPNNCGSCGNVCESWATCRGGACACPDERETRCGDACVVTAIDLQNCGACGNTCAEGQTCQQGTCRDCISGLDKCGEVCTVTNSDPANCGSCGNDCGDGQCVNGVCETGCPSDTGRYGVCDGRCVDNWFSVNHCGGCNSPCPDGERCLAPGVCTACTSSDRANGRCQETCDPACTNGKVCANGECGWCSGSTWSTGRCLDRGN